MKVFLIGLPGVGKSYWGRKLSSALSFTYIDLDKFIETQQQKSISEIFEHSGEEAFRKIECDALKKTINSNENIIVSCGGGTPLHFNNMDLMQSAGQIIYLKASISAIMQKMQATNGFIKRPLFKGSNKPEQVLESLLEEREPTYKKADHIIEIDRLENPLNEILRILKV